MINKAELKEYIYNNTTYGKLIEYLDTGEDFILVDGWSILEHIQSLQGINSHTNRICKYCSKSPDKCSCKSHSYVEQEKTLDLEGLIGFTDYDGFYPVEQEDINDIQSKFSLITALENGQLMFTSMEHNLEQIKQDLQDKYQSSLEWIIKWIVNYPDDKSQDLYDLNYWIKDDIETNHSIEYGFTDEYYLCDSCGINIFRISPDSYGWIKSYMEFEQEGLICLPCCKDNLDDIISEIQDKIKSGKPVTLADNLFDMLPIDTEWIKVNNPLDTYYGNFSSGLHISSGKDNPTKQGIYIKSLNTTKQGLSMLDCLFRIYPSQFETDWSIYIRFNPEWVNHMEQDNPDLKNDLFTLLHSIADKLSNDLSDNCQDKYSYGELCSRALKNDYTNTGRPFNKIIIDTDTGEINVKSYDNLEDYQND